MTSTPLGPGTEFDRIRAIARALGTRARDLGDDCALLPWGEETLALSVDLSVEGVHFQREWLSPREIGWRAGAAALSDLAAVAASPLGVLAGVTAPVGEPESTTVDLMGGVADAAAAVGAPVLGGDLSRGGELSVAVTVVGRTPKPVRRTGATAGDALWVTGWLGGARAALAEWLAGREPPAELRRAFARPEPRIAAAQWLAERGARAMLDLSDGLAGDARHLAAANRLGLVIELERLPLGTATAQAASRAGQDPAVFAALGGEDY